MTRQPFFNLALLALLAVLALNTASIARSLRRIERIDRHRLFGWYFMRPPIRTVGKTLLGPQPIETEDVKAPLSQWTIVETFTTEKECEAHRHPALPGFYYEPGGGGMPLPIITGQSDQCIGSDDPRLTEK